jgi:hypothetical protein
VPAGGTSGQVLQKNSATDYDTAWQTATVAPGSITTTQIADGTIQAVDLANAAVTNQKLASDTARLNLLTNPGFDRKQRAASTNSTAAGLLVDGWQLWLTGSSAAVHSQVASTIGSNGSSLQIAYTHAAGGSADTQSLKVMDDTYNQLWGKTLTLAVWVKSTVAGTVRPYIYDATSGFRFGSYNIGTGAERLTITAVIGGGSNIVVGMRCDVANCTVEFNDATLVIGSVAADYAPLHPADDLARCLRYYETMAGGNTQQLLLLQAYNTASATGVWQFKANKAITPSCTSTPVSNFALLNAAAGGITVTSLSLAGPRPDAVQVTPSVSSGLVAGNATVLIANSGGTSAVLIAEANP